MTAAVPCGRGFDASAGVSTSHLLAHPPDWQPAFRGELTRLLVRHGHSASEPFTTPYRIDCWIVQRTQMEQTP